jgi:hypothetical protein
MSFEDFMDWLQSCPHIAEKLILLLDITDVVRCLKTCKKLRKLIVSTLEDNKKLKMRLDTEASKHVCTRGTWRR